MERRWPKIPSAQPCSRFRQLSVEEKQETIETIRASGASLCMVGLGCPRQEVWAYEFVEALSMPVLAVGAGLVLIHQGLLAAGVLPQRRHRSGPCLGSEFLSTFLRAPSPPSAAALPDVPPPRSVAATSCADLSAP